MTNTSTLTSRTTQSTSNQASNSKEESLLVKFGDKWVNLDIWKRTHPGGAACLERFRGQDATDAFESLHSKEAIQMLNKMKNVESSVTSLTKQHCLEPTSSSLAFRTFRAQLEKDGWFERNWFMDAFLISLMLSMAIIATVISYSYPIAASVILGVAMQQAGWIGHDYVHGRGKVSTFFGIAIGSLINGFSSRWWSNKHNTHHVHTNQLGVDDDIQNDPILHLWIPEADKDHPLRPYQHLYYHIVYAFLYVSWRIQSIQYAWATMNKLELVLISINYIWLLCLPLQVSIGAILIGGFLVAEVVTATHQSEEIIPGLSYDFAADQFKTTRDVDIDSVLINYLWGGMQYQLEHHLFPTMPKYRYPALKSKLKEFAAQNGLEYRTSSASEIMVMNYETMKRYAAVKTQ